MDVWWLAADEAARRGRPRRPVIDRSLFSSNARKIQFRAFTLQMVNRRPESWMGDGRDTETAVIPPRWAGKWRCGENGLGSEAVLPPLDVWDEMVYTAWLLLGRLARWPRFSVVEVRSVQPTHSCTLRHVKPFHLCQRGYVFRFCVLICEQDISNSGERILSIFWRLRCLTSNGWLDPPLSRQTRWIVPYELRRLELFSDVFLLLHCSVVLWTLSRDGRVTVTVRLGHISHGIVRSLVTINNFATSAASAEVCALLNVFLVK